MASIDITTEITGNVWKVLVEPGAKLEEGDPLIILESMKMEIPIAAPEAGVVTEVLVSEGETAAEGSVVVRMDV